MSFRNVELASGSASVLTIDNMVVGGDLVITNVSSIVGTIEVQGNVSSSDPGVGGPGTILFTGTGDQSLSATNSGVVPGVKINKTTGTLSLVGTVGVTGDWIYENGNVVSTDSTIVFGSYGSRTVTTYVDDQHSMSFYNVVVAIGSADTLTVTSPARTTTAP